MSDSRMDRREFESVLAEYIELVKAGRFSQANSLLDENPDHADSVRSAIDADEDLRNFMDDVTIAPLTAIRDQNTVEPTMEGFVNPNRSVGAHRQPIAYFGDYELLSEIARGGMGVVYKARQVNLDRIVAIKMILTGQLASDCDVRRFYHEAEASANLQHPGIVPIYEVGEHNGQHFFSMAFVDGPSLAQVLIDGPLTPREAAGIVRQVAETIGYAHSRGVIHRDLKPANILMSRPDSRSSGSSKSTVLLGPTSECPQRAGWYEPLVTDFGLAKHTADTSELTGTGQILGTPSYMPPEQASAKLKEIGPAADVYSLGAVLYSALVGRPPFQSANVVDTLLQVLEQDAVPPRQLNPQVPLDLETICLKCLQKEPKKRYESADALADELGRFVRGEPILARPVGRLERTYRWCARNPGVASLMALVAVVLMIGTIVSSYFAVNEQAARELADSHREQAEQAADEARRSQRTMARHLYVSQMNLAQNAWKNDNVGRTVEMLNSQQPVTDDDEDLRGFEWHYWWNACHSDLLTIDSHDSWLNDVAISPDGTIIASAGNQLHLWDIETGKNIARLNGVTGHTLSVAFSPDGKRLASGGADRIVRVWDVKSGRLLTSLQDHQHPIESLSFHPNGKLLASAGGDFENSELGEICLWDIDAAKQLSVKPQAKSGVLAIRFSPDGHLLATGRRGGHVEFWNYQTGEATAHWRSNYSAVTALAFSPDSKRLACSGWSTDIQICDTGTGKELIVLKGAGQILSVAFQRDGQRLVSGGNDQAVHVWDTNSGKLLRVFKGHTHDVASIVVHPDDARIISCARNRMIKIWDASSSQESILLSGQQKTVSDMKFSPDQRWLACVDTAVWNVGDPGAVQFWNTTTLAKSHRLTGHTGAVNSFAFSPDGISIATASEDRTVMIWDVATGSRINTFLKSKSPLRAVEFSPDGRFLVTGTVDNTVQVWDSKTRQEIHTLAGSGEEIKSLTYSSDGRLLAAASSLGSKVWESETGLLVMEFPQIGTANAVFVSNDEMLACAVHQSVHLIELKSGKPLKTFTAHNRNIADMAISPDGKRLLTCSEDRTVKLWDMATGEQVLALDTPDVLPRTLAMSPGGDVVAAGGEGLAVTLWESSDRTAYRHSITPLNWMHGHEGPIRDLAFSPDGQLAASASGWPKGDKTVRLWDVHLGKELRRFDGHTDDVQSVHFADNGTKLLSSGHDGTLRLWNIETGEEIQKLTSHEGRVLETAISPGGHLAVSGGDDAKIRLWDIEASEKLEDLDRLPDRVLAVAISPTSQHVLAASAELLYLYDVAQRKRIHMLSGHSSPVEDISFSADGQFAASCGGSEAIVWDVAAGQSRCRIATNGVRVFGVKFSQDGMQVIGALGDGTVRIWDAQSGDELYRLSDHHEIAWAITVSPDGRYLLSGGGGKGGASFGNEAGSDHAIRRWEMPRNSSFPARAD
ncbi:protein kinase domain-containing protein [Stieleria varia]|uniref:Serine/threonine-protein kinase PrkC n=1 Tax=Stieleria varia TaxID=2528005 RepID=A0A5C6ATD8_9BACT|nr:protein kinase [Stieleria varia]TWU02539.1 Serine/threonine-protein kinase PrkC [Stieleria varia]